MKVSVGKANLGDKLKQHNENLDKIIKEASIGAPEDNRGISEVVHELIANAETIAFSYDTIEDCVKLYSKVAGRVKTKSFNGIGPEEYIEFCRTFNIDETEKFNCSTWISTSSGDLIRVFSVNQPVSKYPNVTLNISRKPMGIIDQAEIRDYVNEIVTSRFIIVGSTGSGKTYFLNNALKIAFEGTDNRIALVEEFHELFPPNNHSFMMDANPGKPNEPSIFDYVIQQTNLMRVQNIFVGEVKGKEAFPFVVNMASGTNGGATMHGKSSEDGLSRLQMLAATAGVTDRESCGELIARAIKYVIYIEEYKVRDIKELTGVYNKNSGKFQMKDIY